MQLHVQAGGSEPISNHTDIFFVANFCISVSNDKQIKQQIQ